MTDSRFYFANGEPAAFGVDSPSSVRLKLQWLEATKAADAYLRVVHRLQCSPSAHGAVSSIASLRPPPFYGSQGADAWSGSPPASPRSGGEGSLALSDWIELQNDDDLDGGGDTLIASAARSNGLLESSLLEFSHRPLLTPEHSASTLALQPTTFAAAAAAAASTGAHTPRPVECILSEDESRQLVAAAAARPDLLRDPQLLSIFNHFCLFGVRRSITPEQTLASASASLRMSIGQFTRLCVDAGIVAVPANTNNAAGPTGTVKLVSLSRGQVGVIFKEIAASAGGGAVTPGLLGGPLQLQRDHQQSCRPLWKVIKPWDKPPAAGGNAPSTAPRRGSTGSSSIDYRSFVAALERVASVGSAVSRLSRYATEVGSTRISTLGASEGSQQEPAVTAQQLLVVSHLSPLAQRLGLKPALTLGVGCDFSGTVMTGAVHTAPSTGDDETATASATAAATTAAAAAVTEHYKRANSASLTASNSVAGGAARTYTYTSNAAAKRKVAESLLQSLLMMRNDREASTAPASSAVPAAAGPQSLYQPSSSSVSASAARAINAPQSSGAHAPPPQRNHVARLMPQQRNLEPQPHIGDVADALHIGDVADVGVPISVALQVDSPSATVDVDDGDTIVHGGGSAPSNFSGGGGGSAPSNFNFSSSGGSGGGAPASAPDPLVSSQSERAAAEASGIIIEATAATNTAGATTPVVRPLLHSAHSAAAPHRLRSLSEDVAAATGAAPRSAPPARRHAAAASGADALRRKGVTNGATLSAHTRYLQYQRSVSTAALSFTGIASDDGDAEAVTISPVISPAHVIDTADAAVSAPSAATAAAVDAADSPVSPLRTNTHDLGYRAAVDAAPCHPPHDDDTTVAALPAESSADHTATATAELLADTSAAATAAAAFPADMSAVPASDTVQQRPTAPLRHRRVPPAGRRSLSTSRDAPQRDLTVGVGDTHRRVSAATAKAEDGILAGGISATNKPSRPPLSSSSAATSSASFTPSSRLVQQQGLVQQRFTASSRGSSSGSGALAMTVDEKLVSDSRRLLQRSARVSAAAMDSAPADTAARARVSARGSSGAGGSAAIRGSSSLRRRSGSPSARQLNTSPRGSGSGGRHSGSSLGGAGGLLMPSSPRAGTGRELLRRVSNTAAAAATTGAPSQQQLLHERSFGHRIASPHLQSAPLRASLHGSSGRSSDGDSSTVGSASVAEVWEAALYPHVTHSFGTPSYPSSALAADSVVATLSSSFYARDAAVADTVDRNSAAAAPANDNNPSWLIAATAAPANDNNPSWLIAATPSSFSSSVPLDAAVAAATVSVSASPTSLLLRQDEDSGVLEREFRAYIVAAAAAAAAGDHHRDRRDGSEGPVLPPQSSPSPARASPTSSVPPAAAADSISAHATIVDTISAATRASIVPAPLPPSGTDDSHAAAVYARILSRVGRVAATSSAAAAAVAAAAIASRSKVEFGAEHVTSAAPAAIDRSDAVSHPSLFSSVSDAVEGADAGYTSVTGLASTSAGAPASAAPSPLPFSATTSSAAVGPTPPSVTAATPITATTAAAATAALERVNAVIARLSRATPIVPPFPSMHQYSSSSSASESVSAATPARGPASGITSTSTAGRALTAVSGVAHTPASVSATVDDSITRLSVSFTGGVPRLGNSPPLPSRQPPPPHSALDSDPHSSSAAVAKSPAAEYAPSTQSVGARPPPQLRSGAGGSPLPPHQQQHAVKLKLSEGGSPHQLPPRLQLAGPPPAASITDGAAEYSATTDQGGQISGGGDGSSRSVYSHPAPYTPASTRGRADAPSSSRQQQYARQQQQQQRNNGGAPPPVSVVDHRVWGSSSEHIERDAKKLLRAANDSGTGRPPLASNSARIVNASAGVSELPPLPPQLRLGHIPTGAAGGATAATWSSGDGYQVEGVSTARMAFASTPPRLK